MGRADETSGMDSRQAGVGGAEGDEFRVVVPYVRPVEHSEAVPRGTWGLHFPVLTNLGANGAVPRAQTSETLPGYLRPRKAPPLSRQAFLENPRLSHMCSWTGYLLGVTALCWCPWARPQRPLSPGCPPGENQPPASCDAVRSIPGVLTGPSVLQSL